VQKRGPTEGQRILKEGPTKSGPTKSNTQEPITRRKLWNLKELELRANRADLKAQA
jgi:hypothetical protein